MASKILVIDDEKSAVQLLHSALQREGYHVLSAHDGVEGLHALRQKQPHLVLLDLLMPRMNGWEVCRRIREYSDAPIIVLTALGSEQDKVRGLALGADDYLTKPFSMAELLARIRAALRRYKPLAPQHQRVRVDDRLLIDRARCQVIIDGQEVALSPTEYKILDCFLDNADRILTHQNLLSGIWGWEYVDETDYLKVYIHHLRKKIEKNPRKPNYILTERGLGYRFQVP